MKILEVLDPTFVQARKDEKSFDNMATCGCGAALLVIVGGILYALYFFLK